MTKLQEAQLNFSKVCSQLVDESNRRNRYLNAISARLLVFITGILVLLVMFIYL